ncbi:alpha/beta hydrolase [Virgisporangium aurantiacum]|uniref:Alpha/beta hydrolase n=1 Tax=Virgisporangium aurantiacum TaxID=175570 RepID=A0A8J3YZ24_9ACTN|nr:alpha/beta hydrolase [Virgisporangium aurantiacum]
MDLSLDHSGTVTYRLGVSVDVVTDVLGEPYTCRTIPLRDDDEGVVTASLVACRSDRPTNAAVLYVHGFVDYFFQTHLAEFFLGAGLNFYALDLRKYGRSIQPHQTPNFCVDLAEYYEEIDEAIRIIREEDGHDRLLINGHSTGGLVASLWAHDRRGEGKVDAMFLNSPFLDLNAPAMVRKVVAPAAVRLGRRRPRADLRLGLNQVYGRSIHRDHDGEWEYDLGWKPLQPFPVRAGWFRAIRAGHARVHNGLDIDVPVLVACSMASYKRARWGEAARAADSVLDVDQIARWTPALGRTTTLIRIEGGMHDLTLSPEPVREQLFAGVLRWMSAYFPPA